MSQTKAKVAAKPTAKKAARKRPPRRHPLSWKRPKNQTATNRTVAQINRRTKPGVVDRPEVEAAIAKHLRHVRMGKHTVIWMGGPAEARSRVAANGTGYGSARIGRWWSARTHDRAILEASLPPPPTRPADRARGRLRREARAAWREWLPHMALTEASGTRAGMALLAAAKAGLWGFWVSRRTVYALARPRLRLDDRRRLHSVDGQPAVEWENGERYYAWHGVPVSEEVVTSPERITVERIDAEHNAELKRVLIERFGIERYLKESGAFLMHEDVCGRLWGKAQFNDDALVTVEVENSTPEPDGSLKHYFLRVPPYVETAREAVAWSFGYDNPEDYQPATQT